MSAKLSRTSPTRGSANFGSVEHGKDNQKTIELAYAGREDWAVREVISKNKNLTVKAVETNRGEGRVGYNLQLTIKPGARPLDALAAALTRTEKSPEDPEAWRD